MCFHSTLFLFFSSWFVLIWLLFCRPFYWGISHSLCSVLGLSMWFICSLLFCFLSSFQQATSTLFIYFLGSLCFLFLFFLSSLHTRFSESPPTPSGCMCACLLFCIPFQLLFSPSLCCSFLALRSILFLQFLGTCDFIISNSCCPILLNEFLIKVFSPLPSWGLVLFFSSQLSFIVAQIRSQLRCSLLIYYCPFTKGNVCHFTCFQTHCKRNTRGG